MKKKPLILNLCLRENRKPSAHSVCTANASIVPAPLQAPRPIADQGSAGPTGSLGHVISHLQYIQFRSIAVRHGHRCRITSASCSGESETSHSLYRQSKLKCSLPHSSMLCNKRPAGGVVPVISKKRRHI